MIHSSVKIGQYVVIENPELCDVDKGSLIGSHAVIRGKFKMGNNSIFGSHAISDGDVIIGKYTTVYGNAQMANITIGNNCFIGPCCLVTNTKHIAKGKFGYPHTGNDKRYDSVIEDNVIIGAGCLLAPGIIIKKDVRIDMGCVIFTDVLENTHIKACTVWK